MKIAVMSDTHDNLWNLRRALQIVQKEQAGLIIHCGDFVAPFMLKELEKAGLPVYGVLGNNDGSGFLLAKTALTELTRISLSEIVGFVDADGFSVSITHQRVVAEALALTGKYDLVCYGHSHVYRLETLENTLLLNPGEIMGKEGKPGFCTVDTATRRVVRHEIENVYH